MVNKQREKEHVDVVKTDKIAQKSECICLFLIKPFFIETKERIKSCILSHNNSTYHGMITGVYQIMSFIKKIEEKHEYGSRKSPLANDFKEKTTTKFRFFYFNKRNLS